MKRKRLTQVFPFLLPIRKWQRKKLFYLEMLIDGNKYAKNKSEALLPNTVFETSSLAAFVQYVCSTLYYGIALPLSSRKMGTICTK